ncbi:hypothetical protein EPI10_022421 [Gossypium australe]|uniref:Uncharacterized protein n=1 Tax=Gossypium australe TaxID=47621 RepID=A0A5B6WM37_9ROSI|nr:hypothetical protein EPI10_022421 [Gossypium australe]
MSLLEKPANCDSSFRLLIGVNGVLFTSIMPTIWQHGCIISDMCRIGTAWCVGLDGCFKPHMVCRDGRRWCVEDGAGR